MTDVRRERRRPGRMLLWRGVRLWVFEWGFSFRRGVVKTLFVRLGPEPYAQLTLYAKGVQLSLSNRAVAYWRGKELEYLRLLWERPPERGR